MFFFRRTSTYEVLRAFWCNRHFGVRVTGVQSVAGIASVKVAVWFAISQSDLVRYDAMVTSSGTCQRGADIRKHRDHTGRYYADAYVDKNGVRVYVGGVTCSM